MNQSKDEPKNRRSWVSPTLLRVTGFLALFWFLVRVIPKPSRAAYPCQRAAFPLASAFVLWVVGIATSGLLLRRSKVLLSGRKWFAGVGVLVLALFVGLSSWLIQPNSLTLASPSTVNAPIGVARGIQPGRVVWYHDRDATDWEGPGQGYWWAPEHTSEAVVKEMLSATIQALSGETDDAMAWDSMIRFFNIAHGFGDVGYTSGEKIMIKVNLVGCHYLPGWGGTDPDTYDLTSNFDYMNTSPQMMLALLDQLINVVGVAQADIIIGDPLSLFPNQYHAMLVSEFPDVNYLDHQGGISGHPRMAAENSTVPLYWSSHPEGLQQDFILESYTQATYFINLANFKSHSLAGVTLCAKNHYGSLIRYPAEDGFLELHHSLAGQEAETGSYRALVDLMGHTHLGGKTLLYLVDGLYSGCHPYDHAPRRWANDPFANDWTSSIFASLDPVAIESVCFDIMQLEGDSRLYPQMAGVDDFLHEAAEAFDPPSGTYYDPDHVGDEVRLPSLGVHEHWNNSVQMKYSRNLGSGDGIELVRLLPLSDVPDIQPNLLAYCYPNPFNPRTNINFELPEKGHVRLAVYDLSGARVASLVDESLEQGRQMIPWNGCDNFGAALPSGIYFFRLMYGDLVVTNKMTLIR